MNESQCVIARWMRAADQPAEHTPAAMIHQASSGDTPLRGKSPCMTRPAVANCQTRHHREGVHRPAEEFAEDGVPARSPPGRAVLMEAVIEAE